MILDAVLRLPEFYTRLKLNLQSNLTEIYCHLSCLSGFSLKKISNLLQNGLIHKKI